MVLLILLQTFEFRKYFCLFIHTDIFDGQKKSVFRAHRAPGMVTVKVLPLFFSDIIESIFSKIAYSASSTVIVFVGQRYTRGPWRHLLQPDRPFTYSTKRLSHLFNTRLFHDKIGVAPANIFQIMRIGKTDRWKTIAFVFSTSRFLT